jgi:mRNA interferase RelE/StbE
LKTDTWRKLVWKNEGRLTPARKFGGSLAWTIEYDEGTLADLKKLDRQMQREILDYMDKRIGKADDPRVFGKPLRHSKFGLWRYRVRDYRIICKLRDAQLRVLVVTVSHLSIVYE